MFFIKEYKPKKIKKPDIFTNRKRILNNKNKNLDYLLKKRFGWMSKYLLKKKIIIELGSGNGCIKYILKNNKIIVTDIIKYPWINKKVDMTKINLNKKYLKKVDIFIINHSLHHCPNPSKSLQNMSKFLNTGGLVLLNEPETSFFLKFIQLLLDDEGWSLKAKVFNKKKDIFNSKNPWVSNTAIANLLFKNEKRFTKYFPQYQIKKNTLSEFFIFLNSGGVNTKFSCLPLNNFFLKIVDIIDKILIYFFPSIFALNRSIILKKIK
jgi:SAM-dependent methyltransferase